MGRIIPHRIPVPNGGLNLREASPADPLAENEMTACKNIVFRDGLAMKRPGYSQMGSNLPLNGSIVHTDQFELFGGTSHLLAATPTDVYKWDSTNTEWDKICVNTQRDDCETNWTATDNVACALDADDKQEGSNSVKITPTGDFATGILAYHNFDALNISAHNYIRLWIKSSIAQTAGHLELLIDDTNNCASPLRSLALPALTADTWTEATLDMRSSGVTSDLTAILSFGLNATSDFGTCDIHIDDLRTYLLSTGSDSDFPSSTTVYDVGETEAWWIYSNGVDSIKKWTGDGSLADLGGSPPLAKYVLGFKAYLLLLYTTEGGNPYPQRVRWPDTGDHEDWTGGNASYQDLPGTDWIMGGAIFKGDYAVVLKRNSIWLGYLTGDSDIFRFEPKSSQFGCVSARTIKNIPGYIVFLGADNVYAFDGIDPIPIGSRIQRDLIGTMNPAEQARAHATLIGERNEYWLFVPRAHETYPNIAWCYNWKLDAWTYLEFADYLAAAGQYTLSDTQAAITIDELTGTIDEQLWRPDDRLIGASVPVYLLGDSSGYVYRHDEMEVNDDGAAIDAYWETKDYHSPDPARRIRAHQLDVRCRTSDLTVSRSVDGGLHWNAVGTANAAADFTVDHLWMRTDADRLRLRFKNNATGERPEFRDAVGFFEISGKRL